MRAWKQFYDSPHEIDGPPPTVAERAQDEIFANAVNALAATLRFDIEAAAKDADDPRRQLAYVLRITANRLLDDWSPDALAVRDVFDTHGAEAICLALRRAYSEPQRYADLVGD